MLLRKNTLIHPTTSCKSLSSQCLAIPVIFCLLAAQTDLQKIRNPKMNIRVFPLEKSENRVSWDIKNALQTPESCLLHVLVSTVRNTDFTADTNTPKLTVVCLSLFFFKNPPTEAGGDAPRPIAVTAIRGGRLSTGLIKPSCWRKWDLFTEAGWVQLACSSKKNGWHVWFHYIFTARTGSKATWPPRAFLKDDFTGPLGTQWRGGFHQRLTPWQRAWEFIRASKENGSYEELHCLLLLSSRLGGGKNCSGSISY